MNPVCPLCKTLLDYRYAGLHHYHCRCGFSTPCYVDLDACHKMLHHMSLLVDTVLIARISSCESLAALTLLCTNEGLDMTLSVMVWCLSRKG